MAIAAVRPTAALNTRRNSSEPEPTMRASYPRASATDSNHRNGRLAVKSPYGTRPGPGSPYRIMSAARPPARAQAPSTAAAVCR